MQMKKVYIIFTDNTFTEIMKSTYEFTPEWHKKCKIWIDGYIYVNMNLLRKYIYVSQKNEPNNIEQIVGVGMDHRCQLWLSQGGGGLKFEN